jgi:hypothetical protein
MQDSLIRCVEEVPLQADSVQRYAPVEKSLPAIRASPFWLEPVKVSFINNSSADGSAVGRLSSANQVPRPQLIENIPLIEVST